MMSDVESQSESASVPRPVAAEEEPVAAEEEPATVAEEAEETTEYASSAIDSAVEYINDTFGEKISSTFLGAGGGEEEEESGDADIIWLLLSLALSKLGITLSVNLDWGAFEKVFGWTTDLSIGDFPVPNVEVAVVRSVIGTGLLLVQPLCLLRMHMLAREHQGRPIPGAGTLVAFFRMGLNPEHTQKCTLSPMCILLWIVFWACFIPTVGLSMHEAAGFTMLFLGAPAVYFTAINFYRKKSWEAVDLRCAEVVKLRQFENRCMSEGSFLLFLFVASYAFVMNFLISYMPTWEDQSDGENAALFFGFMFYSTLPLVYLYRVIKDEEADRTFRLFREQLVSAFNDQNMYMKLVLLVEAMLFSLFMVAIGGNPDGELACGFLVSLFFFAHALYFRPFNEAIENYTDLFSRGCSQLTLFVACIVAASGNAYGTEGILIVISLVGAAWFVYFLDFKDMFLKFLFLLVQLRAQEKASHYTPEVIRNLPSAEVKRISTSAIELYVLSALQKINFATLRKSDFFHADSLVSGLHDLEITWLDLQQADFTAVSLMELGFSQEELLLIPKELNDMGDRSDILAMYERVVADNKKTYGDNAPETLGSMFQLGTLLKDMGEHPKALEQLSQCLDLQKEHLGAGHDDTLVTQQFVGEYYTFLKSASQGTEMLRECVNARLATHGMNNPATHDAMRGLAFNLEATGMAKEALELLVKRFGIVMTITHEQAMRLDHPSTLPARLDLAELLLSGGRINSVPQLDLRTVLNRQKTIHGADSRETLQLMDRYAELLDKMGMHSKALGQHLESVGEKEATLGPMHSSTIASRFALGATYIELGRIKDVDALNLPECLAYQEEHLSPTHPATVSSMVKLAALDMSMGRHEDSIALFRKCYDIRCKTLGSDHALAVGVRNNIAACLDSIGKHEEAIAEYRDTVAQGIEHLGEASLITLAARINLAQVLQRVGNLEKAGEEYSGVLEAATRHHGEKHPRALNALDGLASLHMSKDEYDQAVALFEKSLALKANVLELAHPLTLAAMENIAICRQGQHRSEEALQLYEKIIEIRTANCGPDHDTTIKTRATCAMTLSDLGRPQEAFQTIQHCIADATKKLGPKHHMTVEYIAILGHVYCTVGQWDLALQHTDSALRDTIAIFGEEQQLSVSLMYKKAWILQQMNRHTEANALFAHIGREPPPVASQQGNDGGLAAMTANPMFQQGGGDAANAGEGMAAAMAMMGALQAAQQQEQPQSQQPQFTGGMAGIAQMMTMAQQMNAAQQQEQLQPQGQADGGQQAQQSQFTGGMGGIAQMMAMAQQMNAAQQQQRNQQR